MKNTILIAFFSSNFHFYANQSFDPAASFQATFSLAFPRLPPPTNSWIYRGNGQTGIDLAGILGVAPAVFLSYAFHHRARDFTWIIYRPLE